MTETDDDVRASDEHRDWSRPKPDLLARPTYFPAALAFGITLLFWGLVASPVVLIAGAIVLVASLTGWIREIRHER
jgi:hypothetical protein